MIWNSRPTLFAIAAAAGLATAAAACPPDTTAAPLSNPDQPVSLVASCDPAGPVIQLAILLDTSGSMEGLINQARARIWDVVNDLNKAQRRGQRARLEVALYQYGSDQLPSSEGFLTLVQPFTSDLDLLSERLFALQVDGQAEYCGWAIDAALKQLSWDGTPISTPMTEQPLRVLVIAGNEPFTQGPVSYRDAIRPAANRGVIINTIYCGDSHEGARTGWAEGASLGLGAFLAIDHHRAIPVVRCPQDDDLARLNAQLNTTYVPYGARGGEHKARQEMQDTASQALSPSAASARFGVKGSKAYTNAHWDLVDAVRDNKASVETVKTEELPDSMHSMTIEERKREIERLTGERDRLQARIRELAAERERYLSEHRARHPGDTLDSALIRAMREQARRLGFTFE